jgi:hypothetical protein
MTKNELNQKLAQPLTAAKLKKIKLSELQAMVDARNPNARKPRVLEDRVIVAPGKAKDVRPTKAGSKRGLLVQALQRGAKLEHLVELLGWNRATVASAFHTDIKTLGLGVERKGDKYFLLLPKGIKRPPLRDATTTRAEALVAACK